MTLRPAVLLALALLPAAAAHPGDEYETLSAESDGVTFYVSPQTPIVKAGRDVAFLGEASSFADGRYAPLANATWTMQADGPGRAPVEIRPYGPGFAARANFSAPGEWTLIVRANDTSARVPLRVYPASDVRLESPTLRYNVIYAGKLTKASAYFVDDATGSLVRSLATIDARVDRVENGTRVEEATISLAPGGATGESTFEHTFAQAGAYEVRFASPEHGIGYEDLPPFRINAVDAKPIDEAGRETPGPGALLVVFAGAVAVALRARR